MTIPKRTNSDFYKVFDTMLVDHYFSSVHRVNVLNCLKTFIDEKDSEIARLREALEKILRVTEEHQQHKVLLSNEKTVHEIATKALSGGE